METLIHEAPVAFAFYDAQLRYRRINRLLAEVNGVPIGEHIGRRPSEVLDRGLGEAIEAMLRRVLRTGQAVADTDFRTTDPGTGRTRYWQSQWFPARSPSGEVTGVAVFVLDVTERRRSEEALRLAQRRTERLQQATAELAAALTVEAVGSVIGRIGRSTVGARWSGVALLDEATGRLRLVGDGPPEAGAASGLPPEPPAHLATPTSEAIRTGVPVYLGSRADLVALLPGAQIRAWLEVSDERAWAVIPLPGRSTRSGAPVGALRFSFAEERTLEPEDRVFLEALAGQCALALERARLYERQQHTASTLQRSLLPDRLPTVDRLSLGARHLPGGDEAEVGGDWYDVFTLPSGRIALTVGDVMGKGVAAAAVMGRVRSALRALALVDEAPAAVLTGLDRLVTATEPMEQIVTVVFVVVDPVAGYAVGSDAGHPPVVHMPPGGEPVLLDFGFGSTPLGVPEERIEVHAELTPGDVFLGYSDGLVETRERGLTEGFELLLAEVAREPGRPPQRLVDDVLARMLAGQRRRDDVTLLALRWDG